MAKVISVEKLIPSKEERRRIPAQLRRLGNNTVWLIDHYDELRKRYPDEYVAVHQGKVLDHDKNIGKLLRRLEAKYKETTHMAIEFVSKKDFRLIL